MARRSRRSADALSVGTSEAGNTGVTVRGVLGETEGGVTLIDPQPGRVITYAVGDAAVVMLEGDFVQGDVTDSGDASLSVEFREIQLTFSVA